jgi:hypothetical protein
MAKSTVVLLSVKSQQKFIEYYKSLQEKQNVTRSDSRAQFEKADRDYQREVDNSQEQARAKAANDAGDTSRMQNMVVPVVMPQVEAAVVYQSSVFLTGEPIFGVVAGPTYIDAATQLETVLTDNAVRGGWAREFMLSFRDGFKYNFAPLEVSWEAEVTYAVETNLATNLKQGIPKEVLWEGNAIKRLDPYNTFVDTRVAPTEVYKHGEFAGYTQMMSRIRLKAFIASLPDKIVANVVPAFESGTGSTGNTDSSAMNYYEPEINPVAFNINQISGQTNWMSWAGMDESKAKIAYKDSYEVTTLYCRILPSEFDLAIPKANTPQIYKLYIVNHAHIIYAELQTNAHSYLPIVIGQPMEDGLRYQTKSLAANGAPFQALCTAYMTSIIHSRRRAISDRVLFDPSRISQAHINSANPSAKIPVRPAAFGKNISDAVYQFPYREDQAGASMQQISSLLGMANTLNGQNQAQQGQFVKGNKTLHEFESVMQNANGRDQLTSILLEHQIFSPIKLILKLNTLQYQGGTTLYNKEQDKVVEVDPVALRKAVLNFRVSDGLTPASKLLNTDAYGTALQVIGSSPQIANGYNLAPLFSYFMKTQGAKITEFEKSPEQSAYEQALGSWQGMMQLAIEKQIDPKTLGLGEQPKPADFNYDPSGNAPKPNENGQPTRNKEVLQ